MTCWSTEHGISRTKPRSETSPSTELKERLDEWANEAGKGGRTLVYEKKGPNRDDDRRAAQDGRAFKPGTI